MKIKYLTWTAAALGLAILVPGAAEARLWYSGSSSTGSYQVEILVGGGTAPTYSGGGYTYVEGQVGERYVIRVHNRTWRRVEAVISVDNRDAIDGRGASLSKRGYIIPAYSFIDVDGFRISMSEVAAFRFTTVPDSYAARTGTPWTVGVIGVAFFPERVRRYYPPPRPPYAVRDEERSWGGRSAPGDWDDRPAAGAASESAARSDYYRHKNLGTEFGERRVSPVSETHFERENWGGPEARLSLRYDDRQGLCSIGVGAFCYPSYPPYYPPPPPYYPPPDDRFADPPPGWDHFSPWY